MPLSIEALASSGRWAVRSSLFQLHLTPRMKDSSDPHVWANALGAFVDRIEWATTSIRERYCDCQPLYRLVLPVTDNTSLPTYSPLPVLRNDCVADYSTPPKAFLIREVRIASGLLKTIPGSRP